MDRLKVWHVCPICGEKLVSDIAYAGHITDFHNDVFCDDPGIFSHLSADLYFMIEAMVSGDNT